MIITFRFTYCVLIIKSYVQDFFKKIDEGIWSNTKPVKLFLGTLLITVNKTHFNIGNKFLRMNCKIYISIFKQNHFIGKIHFIFCEFQIRDKKFQRILTSILYKTVFTTLFYLKF